MPSLSRLSTRVVLAVLCPGSAAVAQGSGESLVRQMYADVAVEVRRQDAGALLVAAAGAEKTITVRLLARDLRRWADSASRVLSARRRSRADSVRWAATVEGPGVEAGSMSLTRAISPPDTTISVLFADTEFETVRASLSSAEARAFVTAMRKAADAALPAARGRGGAAPRPPTPKQPAVPPSAKPPLS